MEEITVQPTGQPAEDPDLDPERAAAEMAQRAADLAAAHSALGNVLENAGAQRRGDSWVLNSAGVIATIDDLSVGVMTLRADIGTREISTMATPADIEVRLREIALRAAAAKCEIKVEGETVDMTPETKAELLRVLGVNGGVVELDATVVSSLPGRVPETDLEKASLEMMAI